jgi:hypothetical protein
VDEPPEPELAEPTPDPELVDEPPDPELQLRLQIRWRIRWSRPGTSLVSLRYVDSPGLRLGSMPKNLTALIF